MRPLFIRLAAVLGALALATPALPAPPLVEYLFQEAGDSPASTGALDIPLVIVQRGFAAGELPSAAGKGVRGGSDRCLDQSLVEAGSRAWAALAEPDETLDSLLSFTLMGWFKKVGAPPGCDHHFFWMGDKYRFALTGWDDAGMHLAFGGKNAYSGPKAYAGEEWVFFAATYDGTAEKENVAFYKGTLADAARQVRKVSFAEGPQGGGLEGGSVRLHIGGIDAPGRCFPGLLDEIRVFGSSKDASGALDLDAILLWQDSGKPSRPRK
jgi:hypothetical protein